MEPAVLATDRKAIKSERRRGLLRTPSFIIGSAIALFWLSCALVPGLFTNRAEDDPVRNSEGVSIPREGPQANAWFGTDSIGNDVFARVIHGADEMVITTLFVALAALLAGATFGLAMGVSRSRVDDFLARTLEAVVSLPVVLLVLLVFPIYGRSRLVLVLVVAGMFAPFVARAVRSAVLAHAQHDHVTAAQSRGEAPPLIAYREILPNISHVLLAQFTAAVRYAIFILAALSFLGFSAAGPNAADWARDFAGSYNLIQAGLWWSSIFPALAITSLAVANNLIAHAIDRVYSA